MLIKIAGMLSCYDRVLIFGTLPNICFAEGMTSYLYAHKVRIFDYPRFAQPFREELRENAERLATESGIAIEHIRKKNIRKEDLVQAVLAKRGQHPGLVAIFSAMEACPSYQPWHNKQTGKTYLKPDDGKCLHYYFYFLDEELGLTYVRVPTWLPCRLQVYFNGHNWLAAQLGKRKIAYQLLDNAFVEIGDWKRSATDCRRWKSNGSTGNWTNWRRGFAPFFVTLASNTTGAWIKANTPPISFFTGKPIFGPLCQLDANRHPQRQARQHRDLFGKKLTRSIRTNPATVTTSASKARGSNTPWGRCRSSSTTSSA